ncbi:hypothetical protein P170DRAFT_504765 [Aspergillus steynii IBT 23096]|uniref:Uncharacterized protein n=1 Tax=Aspergillus steynii IBT 23096 TaxID=1392250 RepID=A0A2I2GLX3_9EURO|nr:uncharacterized protein P170DRAFT_504765 [Aspergillus steynii IBT 23096]PLB53875.1 hypothetical protein P170DRAFT_504765 [Aspergillus steynii IBT 23096]
MQIPLEINLHILKHLVSSLPINRALRIRLVNSLFAEEIPKLLFRHPTAQEDNFILKKWAQFPAPLKRQYIRCKIDMHRTSTCVFSSYADEMLKTELARTSPNLLPSEPAATAVPFIERVIDIAPHMDHDRWDMFHPDRYRRYVEWYETKVMAEFPYQFGSESVEETVQVVLAGSAILRDEVDLLSWALDSGVDLGQVSRRLELSLVDLIARKGSRMIAELVVERGYDLSRVRQFGKTYAALCGAAVGKNFDALDVWLEHLRRRDDAHLQHNLREMMRTAAEKGEFTMLEFLARWYEDGTAALLYNQLISAINEEDISVIRRLMEYEGFYRTISTKKYPKGPLFTVMWIWRSSYFRAILEMLLKGGVDPDGRYPGVVGTPLQRAVEQGWLDAARTLIQYGADVNVLCIPHRMRKRSEVSLLLVAARKRNGAMVRLLLENGADPASVKNDPKHGSYIQRIIDGTETEA